MSFPPHLRGSAEKSTRFAEFQKFGTKSCNAPPCLGTSRSATEGYESSSCDVVSSDGPDQSLECGVQRVN